MSLTPHQCLGCGQAFPQGSSEILKGCPGCGGTRFFYSKTALPESDRLALKDQQSADVKHVLANLLAENPGASAADVLKTKSWDEWVSVAKPKPAAPTKQTTLAVEAEVAAAAAEASAMAEANAPVAAAAPVPEPRARESPGTVQIVGKGQYEIDVEALMAADPVVIEKDGVFMIHLPSAFERKKRLRA